MKKIFIVIFLFLTFLVPGFAAFAADSWCYNVQNGTPRCYPDKDTCNNNLQYDPASISACTLSIGAAPNQGPSSANAPEFNFKFHPIVSVPLPTSGSVQDGTSLSCYLNALFKLAITVSVVLAVIMIVIDGFKYMTSEAAGGKKDALGGMRSAIFGLILLLASWLILNIINPQILSLRVLNTEKTGVGCNLNVPQEQTSQNPTVQGANIPDPLKTPPQSTFGGSSGLSNTPPSANNLQYCFTTNVPAEGQICGYDLASCNDWRTRDPWKNHQPTICTVPATKK